MTKSDELNKNDKKGHHKNFFLKFVKMTQIGTKICFETDMIL